MQADSKRIIVLGTGGTISGLGNGSGGAVAYRAGRVGVGALVAEAGARLGHAIESEQIGQIDSKDMDFAAWLRLARRCRELLDADSVAGLVVTHGTDTAEETAWFLQQLLEPAKPVVLACAMRPADALLRDGPQNLRDALAVAASGVGGVTLACAGTVHGAAAVRKVHPYRPDAFGSGDAGPVGYVEEGVVRWTRPPTHAGSERGYAADLGWLLAPATVERDEWPRVDIVFSHAGADGRIVDALMACGVDGIVVAATGNGTVHHALEAALHRAAQGGVKVLRATRCGEGRIVPGGASEFADAAGLTPAKARVSLLLELLAERR